MLDSLDDGELMARARAGERAAFCVLVLRHFEPVATFAAKMLRDEERGLEVTQETFVRAFRYRESYRPEAGSVRGWIFSIATNRVRDAARRRKDEPESLAFAAEPVAASEDALATLARGALREAVLAALDDLPPEYREVVVLKYLEDLSYEEVAKALGLTLGAARMRALRARDLLARRLATLVDSSESRDSNESREEDRRGVS